ncbi:MAG: MCE family protein [Acidimicrobiales bacterium]
MKAPRAARTLLARTAVLAAAAMVATGCGISLQSFPKFGAISGATYKLRATFANVLNLPANAQVRDGSAVVGQVTSISTRDYKADLVLSIRQNVHLPVGTTAQVRFDSPLGDEFIVLYQPPTVSGQHLLRDGAVLTEEQTSTAPTIEDTLSALSAVLNNGGIDQLQTIVTELNATLAGNQPQIRVLLEEMSAAVSSLAAHDPSIDNALSAIGALARQLNAGSAVITTGIDNIAPAVTVLANENGDLKTVLDKVTQLTSVANRVVLESGQAAVTDIKELQPVADQLVAIESQLAPTLVDLQRFEASTPKIAPGNYLQTSLNATAIFSPGPVNADNIPTPTANSLGVGAASTSSDVRTVTALLEKGLP